MLPVTEEQLVSLPADGGERFNRLIFEKSPYLQQHAANPVDWFPWGEEAFARAKEEDKPIFLSIGYSTCHWCHVMEHESFEDSTVARLMNENFISIKVDREERPDIDNIYMGVCQMMTGSGGWPLTIIMTPDKKPFFAGTYFPKESYRNRIGMIDLIRRVQEVWKEKRTEINESAEQITDALKKPVHDRSEGQPDASTLDKAYAQFEERFDDQYGGFGTAPKFPTPHNLMFLLRYWKRTGNQRALMMVEKTLQQMRLGGIYDHLGYGFHRYSTDRQWKLPHFEKMLYDQALLAIAYLEAFQSTGTSLYAETAGEIFTYVLRDMTSPEGGFYTAEDADSEGKEGKFYVWTTGEIKSVLGLDADLLIKTYNMNEQGNFSEEATGRNTGENILYLTKLLNSPSETSSQLNAETASKLEEMREKLYRHRKSRIHPLKDDKILADWNGLMIAALAIGGRTLDEPRYIMAAEKAARFILEKMADSRGRLWHRYRDGQVGMPSQVDDYAFFVWGLLELYESTFDASYLRHALRLNGDLLSCFWDEKEGGFFFTARDGEELLVRPKEIYDGAVPSGNSVAALNMLRLGRITMNDELIEKADTIFRTFAASVLHTPSAYSQLLLAVDFASAGVNEIVIAGTQGSAETEAMIRAVRREFLPNKVVVFVPANETDPAIHHIATFTQYQKAIEGRATAYVCRNYRCNAPTTDVKEFLALLEKSK
ncbi:thioredoxin [candidate division KSB1 bacterium RBG_16_48_16]|nr:MAG: thioredoxin [candidate division KSB1 bacterium RBG_16_48_16]